MRQHKYHILILWLSLVFNAMGQEPALPHPEEPVVEDSASFLFASLMIAEPSHEHVQSVEGHAFLRLQCPSADLDFCFSMESGNYESFLDICIGNYPNRLAIVPTPQYMETFNQEGRIVTEYPLNLSREEIQRLWKFLDNTSAQGLSPYHDYFHHGCSQEIIRYLTLNLDGDLVYGEAAKAYGNTIFTIGNQGLPPNSWVHLTSLLFTTDGTDRRLTDAEKTAIPHFIPGLLSDAVIEAPDGSRRPIFKDESPIVHEPAQHFAPNTAPPIYVWFALLLALVVAISILETWWPVRPICWLASATDGVLFTLYNLIFVVTLLVCIFSSLPTTSGWNWNYLIYNPIPLAIWLWSKWHPQSMCKRANTYIYYALWLAAFMVAMLIVGDHFLIEQYLLTLTFTTRCLFKAYQHKQAKSISNS